MNQACNAVTRHNLVIDGVKCSRDVETDEGGNVICTSVSSDLKALYKSVIINIIMDARSA